MPVDFHGKSYKTVAERVNEFRCEHKQAMSIVTKIVFMEGNDCIIQASIMDGDRVIATGTAHEVKGSTNVNKTSHVENCETSAIGRALAAFGYAGTEYASADELTTAVINQAVQEATKPLNEGIEALKACVKAVMKFHSSIMAIKESIATGEFSSGAEKWFQLDDDVKKYLWLDQADGGVFTTAERNAMKRKEFRESYFGKR